jgi:hypothetical protein
VTYDATYQDGGDSDRWRWLVEIYSVIATTRLFPTAVMPGERQVTVDGKAQPIVYTRSEEALVVGGARAY